MTLIKFLERRHTIEDRVRKELLLKLLEAGVFIPDGILIEEGIDISAPSVEALLKNIPGRFLFKIILSGGKVTDEELSAAGVDPNSPDVIRARIEARFKFDATIPEAVSPYATLADASMQSSQEARHEIEEYARITAMLIDRIGIPGDIGRDYYHKLKATNPTHEKTWSLIQRLQNAILSLTEFNVFQESPDGLLSTDLERNLEKLVSFLERFAELANSFEATVGHDQAEVILRQAYREGQIYLMRVAE